MTRLVPFLCVLLLSACADYPPVYAGQVRGTDAAIAMVIDGATTTVYACGGEETIATHTHWFSGGGDPTLTTFEADRWAVDIDAVDGAAASGALVMPSGARLPFTMAATDERPLTRLYSSEVGGCRMGLIAYGDSEGGAQVQGAFCDENGNAFQVTPVDVGPDDASVEIELSGATVLVEPERLGAFPDTDD